MKQRSHGFLRFLEIILYILAAITLLLGVIGGFSLIGGVANLRSILGSLNFPGVGPIINLLLPMIQNAGTVLSVGFIIIGVSLGTVLLAAGRLIRLHLQLDERIARLEAGR